MTAEQKKKLVEVVQHQGGTSAALALAAEVNWNLDAAALAYPMLSEPAVRKRLGLGCRKKRKELEKVLADAIAKAKQADAEGTPPDVERADKQQVEAILTADQLKTLEAIDLRRKVVLAIGYPEKQKIDRLHRPAAGRPGANPACEVLTTGSTPPPLDRQMLGKAVELSTPAQMEQLQAQFDREDEPSE